MIVARFKPSDLDEIEAQPAQAEQLHAGGRAYAEELARHTAFTARVEGRIVAIAGVAPLDRDVGFLWALIANGAGVHFVRLHKMARRLIEIGGKSRLLANTECGFEPGCRWLELLGFTRLDKLEAVAPGARDHWLYLRVS